MTTDMLERLSARSYGYSVFQRLMGDVPTRELFDVIDADVLMGAFEVLAEASADEAEDAEEGDQAAISFDDAKVEALISALQASDEELEGIRTEYNHIFVGPAALPAPPWESVYRDGRRMVMTVTTLGVRTAYKSFGFIPQRYPHVPDDHLALELDFLAALSKEALEALGNGEEEKATKLEQGGVTFAREHLGLWVDAFAKDVREKAKAPFYTVAAEALAEFVKLDIR